MEPCERQSLDKDQDCPDGNVDFRRPWSGNQCRLWPVTRQATRSPAQSPVPHRREAVIFVHGPCVFYFEAGGAYSLVTRGTTCDLLPWMRSSGKDTGASRRARDAPEKSNSDTTGAIPVAQSPQRSGSQILFGFISHSAADVSYLFGDRAAALSSACGRRQ
jgi:hypothetical protein